MNTLIILPIFFIISIVVLTYIMYGIRYGAMYMRVPDKVLKRTLQLVDVAWMNVYDFGAGHGAFTFAAADKGAKHIYAIEIDPIKIRKLEQTAKHYKNITIIKDNLLNIQPKENSIIYCYLSPALMQKIGKKTYPKNTTIISVEHKIPNKTPTVTDNIYKIYIYKF